MAEPKSHLVYLGEAPPLLRARARGLEPRDPKTPRVWAVTLTARPNVHVKVAKLPNVLEHKVPRYRGKKKVMVLETFPNTEYYKLPSHRKTVPFDALHPRHQAAFLLRQFKKALKYIPYRDGYDMSGGEFMLCYEMTKRNAIHAHGKITLTCSDEAMILLHKRLEFTCGRTLFERLEGEHKWDEYMSKDVVEIYDKWKISTDTDSVDVQYYYLKGIQDLEQQREENKAYDFIEPPRPIPDEINVSGKIIIEF